MISPQQRQELVSFVEKGADIRAACKSLGISHATLYRLLARDAGFKESVSAAISHSAKLAAEKSKRQDIERMEKVMSIVRRRRK